MNSAYDKLMDMTDMEWGNPISLVSICHILWPSTNNPAVPVSYPLWNQAMKDTQYTWNINDSILLTFFLLEMSEEDLNTLCEEYQPIV